MKLPVNQVLCGDAFEILPIFPKESIDLIMFSPPYWGLRDYKNPKVASVFAKGGVGLESHPKQYIDRMVVLGRLLRRVLKKQGSMYIVLGDTYYGGAGSKAHGEKQGYLQEAYPDAKENPNRMVFRDFKWLQPKQKLMIPSRVACALQEDGWILRNDIIWQKPNHMPSSVKDRLTSSYEHIFHFVKSKRYYYDLDAIRQPHKTPINNENKSIRKITEQIEFGKSSCFRGEKAYNPRGKNPSDTITVPTDLEGNKTVGKSLPTPKPFNCDRCGELTRDYFYAPDWQQVIPEKWQKSMLCFNCYKELRDKSSFQAKKQPYLENNPYRMRQKSEQYISLDSSKPMDLSHPLGKNPADILRVKTRDEEFKGPRTMRQAPEPSEPHAFHLSGKNPSDFWSINTKPFPQTHFAVYPEEICRMPILSSCPREICVACRKPRKRITKRLPPETEQFKKKKWLKKTTERGEKLLSATKEAKVDRSDGHSAIARSRPISEVFAKTIGQTIKTVGWSDCGCGKGFEAGIVLDPMCGAGTTLITAHKLGRRWIGIDLNASYVEMAKKRIERECSQWLVDYT